jgi:pseudaminic acid biosynthesis-associated methylase
MTDMHAVDYWKGDFGNAYTVRNESTEESLASRGRLFARVLAATGLEKGSSVLEVGTNIGMNLIALGRLATVSRFGVDVNASALARLRAEPDLRTAHAARAQGERLPFRAAAFDLVFTCGVLIHVPPDDLAEVGAEIVRVSARYIVCAEYFSPRNEEIEYRGHRGLLFKRDFGGFFLDRWPKLKLLDYGFLWKRVEFDDLTWWVFEKPRPEYR